MRFFSAKKFVRFGVSLGAVLLIAALLSPFHEQINSTIVALAFLIAVLFSATFFGRNPALLASLAAMLCFNYFFLPPIRTLTISDTQNLVAWFAFTITAIVAGELSSYARRRAEEAERNKLEIERLYLELQDAFEQASQTEALRRSEKLKSALLDAVTHDLRTPLTSIKASVTTLMEDGAKGENRIVLDEASRVEFLKIINEETDRLNQFIGGMVDLARLEAGRLDLRKTWCEVKEIIMGALERAAPQLENHRIIVEIERELPAVRVDAHSIGEVVYTLLDNAAKYSPADTEIRIAARRGADETVEISVEDHGRGIAPEMRERVFDKFYRTGDGDLHAATSGLGMGLAIARGIVESQGGRIFIEDGRGGFVTRFVFYLPIGDDEISEEIK